MFRAPMDCFHLENAPTFIEQLLSRESLERTGYFDADAVAAWRTKMRSMRPGSYARTAVEMGLVGVTGTQLWHQTFIDDSLADVDYIPKMEGPAYHTNGVANHPAGVPLN